jgi:hypothetical protein
VVELVMQGGPDRTQVVEVHTHVPGAEVLVGVHDDLEAVPVQAPGAVPLGEDGDPPRGLEGGGGHVEESLGPGVGIPNRVSSGSARPASAKPLARSRQESHCPQGRPSSPGS